MDITATVRSLLDAKSPDLWFVDPEATVFEAIRLMAEKNVGALPVIKFGRLLGMISERDYTRKVVLFGRVSRQTRVGDIMTGTVITVTPGDTLEDCLALMTENRVRHLPVTEGTRVIGLVSIGDLVHAIIRLQSNAIEDLERYVTGAYPG